MSLELDETGL